MSDATQLPAQDPGLPPGVSAHNIPGNEPEAPLRPRRPYKRGESKADIAVQRHELMREVLQLKNELAAGRQFLDELTATLDAKNEDITRLKARCRWCPLKWWRAAK